MFFQESRFMQNNPPTPISTAPAKVPLYDQDLSAWAAHNANLLRAGKFSELDIGHLIEELNDMGKSEKRALESYVQNLLMHLLKWQFQPAKRTTSWRQSIKNSRRSMFKILRDNPSLQPLLTQICQEEYPDALGNAAAETSLPENSFPVQCPYSLTQLQTQDWLPE